MSLSRNTVFISSPDKGTGIDLGGATLFVTPSVAYIQNYKRLYIPVNFKAILTTKVAAMSDFQSLDDIDILYIKTVFDSDKDTSVDIRIALKSKNDELCYTNICSIANTKIYEDDVYHGELYMLNVCMFSAAAIKTVDDTIGNVTFYI